MTNQADLQADQADIAKYAVRLGDDALILGQRISEWTSNAPFLEEDLALTNVALDFIGRARMFYQYAAELTGGECTEDTFAYTRDVRDFTNLLICELPRGDFAFTIVRQYLYDVYALAYMTALTKSTDERLAAIAGKAVKECHYHVRRGADWVKRLGDGTGESRERMEKALAELWGYTHELFEVDELEQSMIDAGIAPDPRELQSAWQAQVQATLAAATLEMPTSTWVVRGGRTGFHTESLGFLLTELQFMQRAYPGMKW